MRTKLITYKRVLNLGHYESKHLEQTVEILDGEDVDVDYVTSQLMESVERKIREDVSEKIEEEIATLRKELRKLKNEYQLHIQPDTDNIPFDSGDKSNDNLIPEGF